MTAKKKTKIRRAPSPPRVEVSAPCFACGRIPPKRESAILQAIKAVQACEDPLRRATMELLDVAVESVTGKPAAGSLLALDRAAALLCGERPSKREGGAWTVSAKAEAFANEQQLSLALRSILRAMGRAEREVDT